MATDTPNQQQDTNQQPTDTNNSNDQQTNNQPNQNNTPTELEEKVSLVYVGVFGTAPDKKGLDYWVQKMQEKDWDFKDLAENMYASALDYPGYEKLSDPKELIKNLYVNVFNKAENDDPEGIKYWVDLVENKGLPKGLAIANIIHVALSEYKEHPATKVLLNRAKAAVEVSKEIEDADFDHDGKIEKNELDDMKKLIEVVKDKEEHVQKIHEFLKELKGHKDGNVDDLFVKLDDMFKGNNEDTKNDKNGNQGENGEHGGNSGNVESNPTGGEGSGHGEGGESMGDNGPGEHSGGDDVVFNPTSGAVSGHGEDGESIGDLEGNGQIILYEEHYEGIPYSSTENVNDDVGLDELAHQFSLDSVDTTTDTLF